MLLKPEPGPDFGPFWKQVKFLYLYKYKLLFLVGM
jgi:hypothetical protein